MEDWTAIAVLPNIAVHEPVEGGVAALAGANDPRVRALCAAAPRLADFLGRFTDAFGEPVAPVVLLRRTDAPALYGGIDALASFRDALALSVIGQNRAYEIVRPRGHRICYSNAFAFYPWMLDRHGEDLVAFTPAMTALHEVAAFHGQAAPELPVMTLGAADIDAPLLEALLARWRERYRTSRPSWQDRALFRSLNMANQAAQLPAGTDTTLYDAGRMIALWVSAFEILAHPGTAQSGLGKVYDLLEQVVWEYPQSAHRRYRCHGPKHGGSDRRTVACRLYSALHKARNDFLHGNAIAPSRLRLTRCDRSLFQFAAPLYRMALTAFLPLPAAAPIPDTDDPEVLGAAIAEHIERASFQKTIEKALLFARGIDPGRGGRRRGRRAV